MRRRQTLHQHVLQAVSEQRRLSPYLASVQDPLERPLFVQVAPWPGAAV